MRVDFFGLAFETPRVSFYLWSPWRSSAMEHKLFQAVASLPKVQIEQAPDESHVHINDPRTWRAALQAISRVLSDAQEA